MKVLELFSGTGSVTKVCNKLGYEVISVDISDKFSVPTYKCSIMDFDYNKYEPGYFDIVWASPPCATFSKIQYSWVGRGKTMEDIQRGIDTIGLPLLRKTEEIIDYLKPKYYFIENPQTGQMKKYIDRPFYDVDYCKYTDWGYRKRTRIWTNKEEYNNLLCKNDCDNMDGNKHRCKVDCLKGGLKNKYRVPPALIEELIKVA